MANTTDYKTKAYTRKAIDAYNAKKWRVTAMFDLEDNVQERIKKLGYSANDFIKTATIKMLEELENGSQKAEKPIEEPKPVEKHDDDTAAVEETHTKSPYEEMISRRNGDNSEHKPKTPEQIMKELEAVEEINAHPGKFHAGMTMEEYERMKGAEMPPSATEANKNKDDLTFVGGSL